MNNETKSRLFTIITLNETRTILMFVQLTLGQLQEVLPKYVVRILTNEKYRLPKESKVKNYTFRDMKIDSSKNFVVEIDFTRFTKLFQNESYHVWRKRIEIVTIIPEPEVTTLPVLQTPSMEQSSSTEEKPTNTNNGGTKTSKEKPSYYEGITKHLKYSLTYRPGNRFYNTERYSRICA